MAADVELVNQRRAELMFEVFPGLVHQSILATIERLLPVLAAAVKAEEPSRTGRLRASTVASIRQSPTSVIGRVSVVGEYGKAGALEYGSHKTITVRSHKQIVTLLRGGSPEQVEVSIPAYERRTNIDARRFLRGPIDAMRGTIVQALQEAVADAAAKAGRG